MCWQDLTPTVLSLEIAFYSAQTNRNDAISAKVKISDKINLNPLSVTYLQCFILQTESNKWPVLDLFNSQSYMLHIYASTPDNVTGRQYHKTKKNSYIK